MSQFVHVAHSTGGAQSKLPKAARSHAARSAHSRARQLRILEYQSARADKPATGALAGSSEHLTPGARIGPARVSGERRSSPVPSPMSPLSSDRRDPFSSFGRSMSPIEQFLFDHYVTVVIPYMNFHCNQGRFAVCYLNRMMRGWVQLAHDDFGFLNGICLSASRHLSENHQNRPFFERLALNYRYACIRRVNQNISTGPEAIADGTVANALILAWDEIVLHDFIASWAHVQGAVSMASLKGGSDALGLDGFLQHMLQRFVESGMLLDDARASQKEAGGKLQSLEPVVDRNPMLRSFLPLKIESSKTSPDSEGLK